MIPAARNLKTVNKMWKAADGLFRVPKNEKDYNEMTSVLDELIDSKGDENLIETLGTLVAEYENKHIAIKDSSPIEVLKFLMDQNNLKQKDLEKEIGKQSVVSAILSGKRELTVHHIDALSKRFRVSPALFHDVVC